jgi:hypothetical protein
MQGFLSAIKKLGGQDPEQQEQLQEAASWLDGNNNSSSMAHSSNADKSRGAV